MKLQGFLGRESAGIDTANDGEIHLRLIRFRLRRLSFGRGGSLFSCDCAAPTASASLGRSRNPLLETPKETDQDYRTGGKASTEMSP